MLYRFRMLIYPSSGACDLFVEWFHGLYCSVRIEVIALACLFSDECLGVTCVVVLERVFLQILAAAVSYGYWIFFVCSMFFMFPEYILMSCIWAYTQLVRCVLVLRCGLAGVVWCGIRMQLKHYWSVHVKCGGWALMAVWNRGFISSGPCSGMNLPSWWRANK